MGARERNKQRSARWTDFASKHGDEANEPSSGRNTLPQVLSSSLYPSGLAARRKSNTNSNSNSAGRERESSRFPHRQRKDDAESSFGLLMCDSPAGNRRRLGKVQAGTETKRGGRKGSLWLTHLSPASDMLAYDGTRSCQRTQMPSQAGDAELRGRAKSEGFKR